MSASGRWVERAIDAALRRRSARGLRRATSPSLSSAVAKVPVELLEVTDDPRHGVAFPHEIVCGVAHGPAALRILEHTGDRGHEGGHVARGDEDSADSILHRFEYAADVGAHRWYTLGRRFQNHSGDPFGGTREDENVRPSDEGGDVTAHSEEPDATRDIPGSDRGLDIRLQRTGADE